MMNKRGVVMRIRTIKDAFHEIKAADPDTSVTEYAIRRLVVEGVIPSAKSGTKYLIDLDKLQSFLQGESSV